VLEHHSHGGTDAAGVVDIPFSPRAVLLGAVSFLLAALLAA
jgi:hypothetical protein